MKKVFILFLTCLLILFSSFIFGQKKQAMGDVFELQKPIKFLFVDTDNDDIFDADESLVVMSAADYVKVFKRKPPLERMLRSQVKDTEFIVLEQSDFDSMDTNGDAMITSADEGTALYAVYFVRVEGHIDGALIATEAEMVDMGKLKGIVLHTNSIPKEQFQTENETHFMNGGEVQIKSTKEKMPWVGL